MISRVILALPALAHLALLAGLALRRSTTPAVLGLWSWSTLALVLGGTLAWGIWPWLWRRCRDDPRPAALVVLLALITAVMGLESLEPRRGAGERDGWFHPHLQMVSWHGPHNAPPAPDGFRNGPHPLERRPGELRVAVLGGSTALNLYEPDNARTIAGRLASRLRENFPDRPIRVINAANVWYTSQHSLINYQQRVRPYAPDVVVCFHAVNDMCRSWSPPAAATGPFRVDYSHFLGPQIDLFNRASGGAWRNSNLHWLLCEELFSLLREPEPVIRVSGEHDWPSLPVFRGNLEALATLARADGAHLILGTQGTLIRPDLTAQEHSTLALFPTLMRNTSDGPTLEEVHRAFGLFNDTTREVARDHDIPLADLAKILPSEMRYFRDDVHLTAESMELCAAEFARLAGLEFRRSLRTD